MFDIQMDAKSKRIFQKLQFADVGGCYAIRRGIKEGFDLMGQALVRKTQLAIKNGPKTGRIYKYQGRPHQASAPGEAPANRSGDLMASVQHKARMAELEFGYTEHYGGYLEKGTKKMKPRPNIQKRASEMRRDAERYFEKGITRAISKWLG